MSVDGLEWMGARVYDPAARGFLSVDPLDPVVGAGWAGNPYAFAGNDPLHAVDPSGLSPVTDAQLQAYRDSNGIGGTVKTVANAVNTVNDSITDWAKNNWEYVAGGAMVIGGAALMATGVGGPAGMMLISAGADTIIQKATTGEVNWGQVAVSGAAGAIGFGVGGALAKTAMSTGAKTVVANVAEGAVSSGAGYLTGPGPHTVGGLVKNTGFGAATGGVPMRGAAGRELSEGGGRLLSRTDEVVTGCFVAGTPVLLADGTSKPIEDIAIGDEVLAADPDTGETVAKHVLDTYVHHAVETYVVQTSSGAVTSTSEHPFWVDGRGWTPVRELRPGDKLVDADGGRVELVSVTPTGQTATVHNFHVAELHNYHVQTGDNWVRVHNECRIHSRYADGTPVYHGQQPPRLGEAVPHPDAVGAHSQLRWDTHNQRIYQAREFNDQGHPVRDIDFTQPTFPNGTPRPNHPVPEQHPWHVNDPTVGPKSGFRRGSGGPL